MRFSEADILAERTAAGGWSRETLASWGVSWPPQKGWKEALLQRSSAQNAPWVGLVEPVGKDDPCLLYWTTDIPAIEIIEAYAHGLHQNQITKICGRATVNGAVCNECSGPIFLTSRSQAQEYFRSKRGHWLRSRCDECQTRRIEDSGKDARAEHDARDARRRELRFMPYKDFLRTPEWEQTRHSALRRAGFRCQTCASGGELHVHHRTYVNRGAESYRDLTVLCAVCHKLFHDNRRLADNGRARDLSSPAPSSQTESA